ncbi:MAG: hypothetical protein R3183_04090 [Oleiphilaceae bacterium]|nr:hypothetical protein [Oleiphilaceae bacterium]
MKFATIAITLLTVFSVPQLYAGQADQRHEAWPLLRPPIVLPHQENTPDTTAEEAGPTAMDWLREKRNYWGNLVDRTGRRLDGFFAGRNAIERSNDSFVKLGLLARQERGGRSYLEPILKFRLDLPTLEERLKLVFESESDDAKSLAEKNKERTAAPDQDLKQTATGALRYQTPPEKRWRASTSVGVDLEVPPDFFWRARGRYRWDITPAWSFEAQQNVYYFHKSGWGETTRFTFERSSAELVFRTTSEARYLHDERRMEFSHGYSFLKELSPIRAINYQFGILAENKPHRVITDYYANVVYRRKLSQDWLFYEITPAVNFPRDESYSLVPSLVTKIEIVFSAPN